MADFLEKLGLWRALALAAALTAPFWTLSHPLMEVDDARYAEVPREMAESGDWATPTLAGMDYVEKPPLWYWSAAASYKLFGVSERSARLPLAALAALCVAGTAWLGWWLFSPAAGALAAALLSSCGLFFFLSHYATPDLPLTTFLLWSSAFILRALLRPADARWAAPAAWAAAALAFMSKGLVGLVFPVGWVCALALFYPKLRAPARELLSPLGLALFVLIAAPWYLLMQRRHPGFLMFFFGEQHFQRFFTHKYNRTSPAWFFLAVLPAGLLPWMPAGLAGLTRAWKRRRDELPEAALALWTVMVVAFFSTSQSKLATYILPVFPHMALLAARACERPSPVWARRAALGLGAICGVAVLAALRVALTGWTATMPGPYLSPEAAAGAAAAGFGLLCVALVAWGLRRSVLIACACGWALGLLAFRTAARFQDVTSARELGTYVAEIAQPGDELWAYGVFVHGLPFYARHRVDRVINWVGELHYAKRDPKFADRFGDDDDMRRLPLPDRRVILVLRAHEARHVLTLFDGQKVLATRPVGRWVVIRI